MTIGILGTTTKSAGGVYQYTLSLMEALLLHGKKYDYKIFLGSREFVDAFPEHCADLQAEKPGIWLKLKRFLYTETGLKAGDIAGPYRDLASTRVKLIISPVITLKAIYMEKPYVITIHDLQHRYYPEFFTRGERLSRDYKYSRSAKLARVVVCESRFVKDDVHTFFDVPYEKIRIVHSPPPSYMRDRMRDDGAGGRLDETRRKYDLPDGYLFYPAQFWPHKNHVNLVRALSLIKSRFKEEIPLVLVGAKGKNFERTMAEVNRLNLQGQVRYLGYAPEEDMPSLYRLSAVLVLPTLFESLSLPVWEAFHLGVPVVSSWKCALPEQIADAGVLFDPENVEEMAEKIYMVYGNEDVRKELAKKGFDKVKGLTHDNYALQWENLIDEALIGW